MSEIAQTLRAVPWLSSLGQHELHDVAASATHVRFKPGSAIVGELELGDELFVILGGRARVSVASGNGRRDLGELKAGDACGEMSLLTRELRSATVTAIDDVEALRIERGEFEELVRRHPAIAVHFAHAIARRIHETDAALDQLLSGPGELDAAAAPLVGRASAAVASEGSIRRAWRELVVSHRNELPFFALLWFTGTLLLVRLLARRIEARGGSLFGFLRDAYTTGIVLVFVSTAISLVRFRRSVQRVVASVFGVGFALILNELSVFLAFDTYYLDMTTPDPNMVFNVETLYRRSESVWAIALMICFLAQLTFLRPFYRRAYLVLRTRLAQSAR